jgi:hypothetical protein
VLFCVRQAHDQQHLCAAPTLAHAKLFDSAVWVSVVWGAVLDCQDCAAVVVFLMWIAAILG